MKLKFYGTRGSIPICDASFQQFGGNTTCMNKLVSLVLLATAAPFCAQGQQGGGTLTSTLAGQGLAGAKLERRYGNHLLVPVSINNRRGALMIDTGSPNTLIDRNSVNTLGLTVEKTDSSVGGLFGRAWERYGASKVKSIAMRPSSSAVSISVDEISSTVTLIAG